MSKGETQLFEVLGIQEQDLNWTNDPENSEVKKSSSLIKKLSRLFPQPEWSELIAKTFPQLLESIIEYSCLSNLKANRDDDTKTKFVFNLTVQLGNLIRRYPPTLRYAEIFFAKYGSPLQKISLGISSAYSSEAGKKRPRKQQSEFNVDDAITLMKSVLILLKLLPRHITKSWLLKYFLDLLKIGDKRLSWLVLQSVGVLLHFSDKDLEYLERMYDISAYDSLELGLEFQTEYESQYGYDTLLQSSSKEIVLPAKEIVQYSNGLISIGQTLVKSSKMSSKKSSKPATEISLVQLNSTVSYIREIALSLSSNFHPVCLVGPIGSGKSSLIKYTASLFGKEEYPQFISVQMSDQIDSRLLLGSYHSTDLPGQFVWKPGSLTKAVKYGYWIILEDIDSAPPDVMALFDGLIDSQKLCVPGYGEIDSIHPDFRVFATIRTQTGKRGLKLGKQWKKIYIDSMSVEDMKILMTQQFQHLRTVAERLIGIYKAVIEFQSEMKGSNGRVISLRDFLKFCRRISPTLDLTQSHASIVIFQEACDLFISSISNLNTRQEVAELIAIQLNLLRAKAEYFCTTHKPHVNICTNSSVVTAGRYSVPMYKPIIKFTRDKSDVFSLTKRACNLMEALSGCITNHEPVLLIGETGVGKTSCIQYLANVLQQKLVVVNLNRQSDSGDLLGGYKPVDLKYIFSPIREEFEVLFPKSFDRDANSKFLGHIMTCFANRRWKDLVRLMIHVQKLAMAKYNKNGTKEEADSESILQRWTSLGHQLSRIELQIISGEDSPFAFTFIEGTLITAIKNGYWILLDEINLATPEMLQCLSGILDEDSDVHLWEKGDDGPIKRHENFHLFAAMNPSTDVGKKDLPLGLRNRFTEFYVEELSDPAELQILVADYLKEMALSSIQVESIVEFYITIKALSQNSLVDGMGKKPHFSLRTLCRALKISSMNIYGSANRSLYESFCLSFLTQLDYSSHPIVQSLVAKHIFGKTDVKTILNKSLPCPTKGSYVQVEGYWIPQGETDPQQSEKYILTTSIRRNLKDLARIVSAGRLPILIQGETSVGKTSLIQYLAQISGNNCYRINNHQHTDLQEYVGSYQSDKFGKLVFTEGILVTAMRRGEWIILDELNLAPSEVLEALNRLLDDNRQLFITETGQTITAHPRFMLFATQNPPGLYGGRKVLSRAFRNRFIELHFDEIPSSELETILHHRCNIPKSYCKKIIGVLKELQMRRKASAALEGKHGFATLRDLFRWAERYRQSGEQKTTFYDWDQHLADEGYLVLAGKVRKDSEAELIREVLQKHLKRVVDPHTLFSLHEKTSTVTRPILETLLSRQIPEFKHIVWTLQMRRLGVLIGSSIKFKEPILLVGETGGGKTSIVQLLAHLFNQKLFPINCHMHSEGSDFLGGLRPVRNHQENDNRLFEWVDGPLVEAMEGGGIFLADEISLADDSVLERINSVLEPERTLLLAEKGDETPKLVVGDERFHFIGTMNPGGDYGKKELSPALRNRLTEIWCEVSTDPVDIEAIVEHNLSPSVKGLGIAKIMIAFVTWLKNTELGNRCTISIRDYFSWTEFINYVVNNGIQMSLSAAIHHGASLAFLDGIGTGVTATENIVVSQLLRCQAIDYLETQTQSISPKSSLIENQPNDFFFSNTSEYIGIGPFFIKKAAEMKENNEGISDPFNLETPTTSQNALRVLRAMQLKKPILLEGSPGVGKTALVTALGKLCHRSVLRINLSEQTDISDLFGADLPVEGGTGGQFEWRDGPLLQALKNSSWILLDELNLASQSVLEGLNACLDHRGEIYIPELNRTFKIGTDFENRIFGCQNPVRQGGARKGLPKSFLNRFTQVFMDPLCVQDLEWIMQTTFPNLPEIVVSVMCSFGNSLVQAVCQLGLFGSKGSPWDFNLRDLIRWGILITKKCEIDFYNPNLFVDFIYGMRMRTGEDRRKIYELYSENCKKNGVDNEVNSIVCCGQSGYSIFEREFRCGNGGLERSNNTRQTECGESVQFLSLQKQLPALESLTICLEMGWMPILVGPTRAGKTSLVKLLAEFAGRSLKIMNVSPETDTIELLGGFEQADIYRKIDETVEGFSLILMELVKVIVRHKGHNLKLMDFGLLDLWSELHSLPNLVTDGELLAQDEEMSRISNRLHFLGKGIGKCRDFLQEKENLGYLSSASKDFNSEISLIEEELKRIRTHLKSGIRNGAFQWIDSLLVKAIREGDWLLIDGANRCTAAVLDRLNSLMELNGSLFLSERGSIDGNIIEMKPHINFRLILTMDPAFGEISRAMRNRGVEIYIPGPEEIFTLEQNISEETNEESLLVSGSSSSSVEGTRLSQCCEINFLDLDTLCRAERLGNPKLRKELVNLHERLYESVAPSLGIGDRPYVYQVIDVIRRLGIELYHGIQPQQALKNAICSVYIEGNSQLDENLKSNALAIIQDSDIYQQIDSSYSSSIPLSVSNFVTTKLFRVWKEIEILEMILITPYISSTLETMKKKLYKNLNNNNFKTALSDILFLTPFLRTGKSDTKALTLVMERKFPDFNPEISKILVQILESLSSETELPWDPAWKPHFLAKYSSSVSLPSVIHKTLFMAMKTSLLCHKHIIIKVRGKEQWMMGSLGYLCKNINQGKFLHDSLAKNELLSNLWLVFQNFDVMLDQGLRSKNLPEDLKSLNEIGNLWRNGLRAFLWRSRLFSLSHLAYSPKKTNEKFNSKIILAVQWIKEEVIPFLNELDSKAGAELKKFLDSCLKEVDHLGGSSGTLLETGKRFRKYSRAMPFSVTKSKAEVVEEVLELCFMGWSLNSPIRPQRLIPFLNSDDGKAFHTNLRIISRRLWDDTNFSEDELSCISEIKDAMQKLKEMDSSAPPEEEPDENFEIIHAVTGLLEYVRVKDQNTNSAFTHPLLGISQSVLEEFICWEDTERIRSLFFESQSYEFLPMSAALPYFVSRIIFQNHGNYRIATLGSRELVKNTLETTSNVLIKKLTSPTETDEEVITKLSYIMSKVLEDIVDKTSGGCQRLNDSLTKWSTTLNLVGTVEERMGNLGIVLLDAGSTMMEMGSLLPTVDPAFESEVLVEYLSEEISVLEAWVGAQRLYETVETGRDLLTAHMDTVHPSITSSLHHLKTLNEKLTEAKKYGAYRPDPPNYDALRQDIKQFAKSIADMLKNQSQETASHIITFCQMWIDAHKNFVKKVFQNFWYWDISAGFLFASVQLSLGLSLISDATGRMTMGPNLTQKDRIHQLIQFPIPYREETHAFVSMKDNLTKEELKLNFTKSLYTASMISFLNEIETEGCLSSSSIKKLHELSNAVVRIWEFQEEEKRKQKELEDAMYVFKGKERSMDLGDEEQEAVDVANTFPDYVEDLIDLEVQNTLEGGTADRRQTKSKSSSSSLSALILTPEDISLFLKIHHRVMNQIKNHWITEKEDSGSDKYTSDFVTPYLIRFQQGTQEYTKYYKYLGKEEENSFIIGSALAIQKIGTHYEQPDFFQPVTVYDFYHDMNIDEVHKLTPVLDGLKKRVSELLIEWPEHPSLMKILEVVKRMESFRVDSPLMRFLTCLELLLATAQEWESCAHRGVSISLFLTEITDIIISWRKLELQCWKNLLQITFQREQFQAHKWWFHLYNVVTETMNSSDPTMRKELLHSLHQFMESSPIGQFETRLGYLYNIHCHLISIEQNNPKSTALNDFLHPYIWNTYNFYKQFESSVSTKLVSLRSPIEKKMKDFVKISRWNDANYYALKDSVQKNQRMLSKLVKEWKKAMNTPVSSILVADLSGIETEEKLWKRRPVIPNSKLYLIKSSDVSLSQIRVELSLGDNMKRDIKIPKLFKRAQIILKSTLEVHSSTCMQGVKNVEDLTEAIIHGMRELQGLEVTEKTREKRKKMLHNIHFRKRSSLADLFKELQQYNLSYRRGLVQLTREGAPGETLQRDFSIQPVDISAGWTHLSQTFKADKELVKCWEGCETYYQKCMSRMAVMMKSFHSPSKELGPMIIERCRGFVVDLMETAATQKEFLAKFVEDLWVLRNLSSHNYALGQSRVEFEVIYQEACRVEYEARQFQLLVGTLENSSFSEYRDSSNKTLVQILQFTEEIKNTLSVYVDSVHIPNLRHKFIEGRIDLVHSLDILDKIRSLYESIGSDTVIGTMFIKCATQLKEFVESGYENLEELPKLGSLKLNDNNTKFGTTVRQIIQNMLLTFQKLEKLQTSPPEVVDENSDSEASGQNVTNLKETLNEEMGCFEIKKIVNSLLRLLKIMRQENSKEFGEVFTSLSPLLQQYSLAAEFYLMIYVQYHRSTCKLLSVLLRIFSTLASKGFCLPADYEDEAVAEGADMDSSAGMGLGEGETTSDAKDVSDRFESEDQLEDTLKEGETAPSADKDLNDDQKGVEMSEDFDGKQQEKDEREPGENDDKDSESGSDEEDELDKQMGDVDDPSADKLDDQMWGGSSDEEDEDLEEKDEESGKGSNQNVEQELRAKDPTLEKENEENEPEKPSDENKKGKDFNHQEDDEVNEDQVDPYHGQDIPEQEPEDFDLPEEMNLDGAEPKDKDEEEDECPFDLDSKEKEDITNVPEHEEEETDKQETNDENQISDDEDPESGKGVDVEKPQFEDLDDKKKEDEEADGEGMDVEELDQDDKNIEEEEKKHEDVDTGETESEQKSEDKAEPSENTESKAQQDQTTVANEKAKGDQMKEAMDTTEEEKSKNDETASGQAESKDGSGHEGKSLKEDKNQVHQQEKDKNASRKPGDVDNNRSLANDDKLPEQGAKRLKTMEKPDTDTRSNDEAKESDDTTQNTAELYQHVKDAEKSDAVTVDNSTKEQAEKQKGSDSKESKDEETENPGMEDDEMMGDTQEDPVENLKADAPELNAQRLPDKPKSKGNLELDNEEAMEVEVEGEIVSTAGAQRPTDSTIETRFDLLEEWSREKEKLALEESKRQIQVSQTYLTSEEEAASLAQWHELDGKTLYLAQELCEQLRLVLEPTQAARLRGDYKTGKRLNMRKVIPYIASGFRKDKIWLRRTQPSKREYQILLALDDSASMADNQSKQMAFSAVAVVARSLGLLEAGQLGVVGFGEDVQLLHSFDEPFTDYSGAKLIQKFTFAQRATRIAQLLSFSEALFEQAKETHAASSALSPEVAQLLLIISDGRGVSHEGSGLVKRAVRQAREKNIFVVFIVVDNPENKDSILDIRLPIFGKDGSVEIAKYMDHFPFPFYLILRDLGALPSVLSDALRQWFELVTSSER